LKVVSLAPAHETFDQALTTRGSGGFQFAVMYENLIQPNPFSENAELIPMLATQWSVSPDAKTWSFQLRKGVQFQGTWGELTARDLQHTVKQLTRPNTQVSRGELFKEMSAGLEIVNDHQVNFRMINPDPDLTSWVSSDYEIRLMSKAHFDALGQEGVEKKPTGTGPYQFVERALGASVLYERVPFKHWRVTPEFREVQLFWAAEPATRLATLLANEAHITQLPTDLEKDALGRGMKVIESKIMTTPAYIPFGGNYLPTKPHFDPNLPFTNKKVREALNRAVNRKELHATLLGGRGEIMVGPPLYRPEYMGWNPDWVKRFDEMYGYDPKRAKQLLAEAGYPAGFQANLVNVPRPGLAQGGDVIDAIGNYWRAIGVDVKLSTMEFAQMRALFRAEKMHGLAWIDATTRFGTLRDAMFVHFYSKGATHFFESEFLDKRYEQLLVTADPKERERLGRESGDFSVNEYAFLPLFWLRTDITLNPRFVAEYPTTATPFFPWDLEHVKAVR